MKVELVSPPAIQLMLFVNNMSEFLDPINFLKSYSIYRERVKTGTRNSRTIVGLIVLIVSI